MVDGGACRGGGGRLGVADEWGALCFTPVAAPAAAPVAPPARPVTRYSRWHGGTTTYGPRGRVLATLVTLLVPVVMLSLAGVAGLAFGFLWIVFVLPLVLRDVWRRDAVG